MLKIIGLIKTLGWKHFLWKLWLLGKKRSGAESWFSGNVPYDDKVVNGRDAIEFASIGKTDGFWGAAGNTMMKKALAEAGLNEKMFVDSTRDILSNTISYFSINKISFKTLNFNANPIEKIELPVGIHSSRYHSFDPQFGDLKKVWELNRFEWTNTLITAFLLTEDEDIKKKIRVYYEDALSLWLRQCPHERSVAWACSQEVSIRCMNWIWAIRLLEITNENVLIPCFNAIYLSAVKVYSQINFARAQRNNHAITESVFLILFSKAFNLLPQADKYFRKGTRILLECLKDQFFEDGGYIQNSHTYHRFALQSLIVAYPIVDDPLLKKQLSKTMEASYQYLSTLVSGDNGEFPNFGPNDGAMLYNFGGSSFRDLRPVLNQLSILLYGVNRFEDPRSRADTIIHQVKPGDRIFNRPAINISSGRYCQAFTQSGITVLQDGFFKVFFTCVDLTGRYPSSCDQLHIDLWYKGRNILTDSGSWEYYNYRHPEHFNMMLSTSAHNTVMVDGKEQIEKGPRFSFITKSKGEIIQIDKENLMVEGVHDGYKGRIHPDTVHQRKVSLHEKCIKVEDIVVNAAKEAIFFWHFSEEEMEWDDKNYILVLKESKLKMTFKCSKSCTATMESFPCSLYYSKAVFSPMLRIIAPAGGERIKMDTLLEVL